MYNYGFTFQSQPVLTSMIFLKDGQLLTVINHQLVIFDLDTQEHNITGFGMFLSLWLYGLKNFVFVMNF